MDYRVPLWVYFKVDQFITRLAEIVRDTANLYELPEEGLDGYGETPGVITHTAHTLQGLYCTLIAVLSSS